MAKAGVADIAIIVTTVIRNANATDAIDLRDTPVGATGPTPGARLPSAWKRPPSSANRPVLVVEAVFACCPVVFTGLPFLDE